MFCPKALKMKKETEESLWQPYGRVLERQEAGVCTSLHEPATEGPSAKVR
jgi:hypothetical protein